MKLSCGIEHILRTILIFRRYIDMARTVKLCVFDKKADGLIFRYYPGALGKRIFDHSQRAFSLCRNKLAD